MKVTCAWRPLHYARLRDSNICTHPRHPCKLINNDIFQHFYAAKSNSNAAAMASGRDVRDMLGLPVADVAPPTAAKKSKKGGGSKRIRTFRTHAPKYQVLKRDRG